MEDFIKLSRKLGSNKIHAQGAGGNSSMKLGNILYIKASGVRLSDMNHKKNIVKSRYKILRKFFHKKDKHKATDEIQFNELIQGSILDSELKPSMEIGFHTVINSKYIFHLHNIHANVFNCMKDGDSLIKQIFIDLPFNFVVYKNPGYELALYLSELKRLHHVIFLGNHGIIVHGNNLIEIEKTIKFIDLRLRQFIYKNKAVKKFSIVNKNLVFKKFVFPDAAVFTKINFPHLSAQKRENLLEIKSAQLYIIETIKKINGKTAFLSKDEVLKLRNMPQEKYRLKK